MPGEYVVELDLVWEGMLWFKENGNSTAKIDLREGTNEISSIATNQTRNQRHS